MARDLSWNRFVSQNYFLICYTLFVIYITFREIRYEHVIASAFKVLEIFLIIWCKKYASRKGAKHRSAPKFLKLSEEVVLNIQNLVNGRDMRLNKRQCLDLSSKLSQTVQNIHKMERLCGFSDSIFRPSLERFYQVLLKAKFLVNDCCNKNWIRASVFQMQNESAFQVILMDLGFCYHAIYEQARLSMSGESRMNVELEDLRDSSTFQPASMTDVDEDREELRKRLVDLVDARKYGSGWLFRVYYFLLVKLSKKLRLAEYLLVKLQCIAQHPLSDGLQLSRRLLWEEESWPIMTWGGEFPLGVGAGASGVFKTKWLNIPCAKKCSIPEPYFLKEAGILSHVNYPNIIKFICCGEKNEVREDFIGLELMEMSLSDLIEEKGEKGIPFSFAVAVDIVAQIGRGMCYLHGLSVAHRDLKPTNVVLSVLTSPHLEDTYHVKLVDFGTSKTEVDPLRIMCTAHGFNTLPHNAPEVRHLAPAKSEGDRKWRAVWFKADVWSFAVVCLEVLSLKLREGFGKEDEDLKSMFPEDCPRELVALLEGCLQVNPRARPDFLEVCWRLEALRHRLLQRLPDSDQDSVPEMSLDCSSHQYIEMSLEAHFQRQNTGGVADVEEVEVDERASQEILRMDQGPYSTTVEDPDRRIWTKQPGNEVLRKAVEEWRKECGVITARLQTNVDQQFVLLRQCDSRKLIHSLFALVIAQAFIREDHLKMPYNWAWSPVFLEALFYLCLVIYQYRCLWRLWKAFCNDLNKLAVYYYWFAMLDQKRELFSIEEDTKEYNLSSLSPPKPTWIQLPCVKEVFWGLLPFILLIIFFGLYSWIGYLLKVLERSHFLWT